MQVMHLIAGSIFALIYADGFEYLPHQAGWLVGVGFSIIHILSAGLLLGMVPVIHPLIPESMPAPGMFMSNLGLMGVAAFIMLHLDAASIMRQLGLA